MAELNSHKWFIVPENVTELQATTKELIIEIREQADEQSKLQKLEGNEELFVKLDEVFQEIDSQFVKISATLKSTMVHTHLRSLCANVQKIHEFFGVLRDTKMLFFRKKRLGKEMTVLYNNLRHSCTQLMASVSLELLNKGENAEVVDRSISEERSVPIREEPVAKDANATNEIKRANKYFYGINRSVNYTLAFESYLRAADKKNFDGMAMVGFLYFQGYGVDKDEKVAIETLKKVVKRGHALGKYLLGVIYIHKLRRGDTIAKPLESHRSDDDADGDSSVLTDVAETEAQREAQAREELFQSAVVLLTESAERGHLDAQTALGQLFELAGDFASSVKWYEIASSGGCLRAKNLLGMLYFDGKGVKKLREKAYSLFKESADGGEACAMNNVAMCLERGMGVEPNMDAALSIYKAAAAGGSAQAAYSYGYLLLRRAVRLIVGCKVYPDCSLVVTGRAADQSTSVEREKDLQEGIYYLRVALEKGVAEAGYQIARLYEQGIGVPLDPSSAYSNFLWASRLGHGKAALCAANMLYESSVSSHMRDQMYSTTTAELIPRRFLADDESTDTNLDISHNLRFAASLYHQASRTGIVEAMNAYAVMLEDGLVDGAAGPGYLDMAATWYHGAAEGGLLEAVGNLDMLLRKNNEIQKVVATDGRLLERDDILRWTRTIKSSPYIRQAEINSSSVHQIPLCIDGSKKQNPGGLESKDEAITPELHVSILPKLTDFYVSPIDIAVTAVANHQPNETHSSVQLSQSAEHAFNKKSYLENHRRHRDDDIEEKPTLNFYHEGSELDNAGISSRIMMSADRPSRQDNDECVAESKTSSRVQSSSPHKYIQSDANRDGLLKLKNKKSEYVLS